MSRTRRKNSKNKRFRLLILVGLIILAFFVFMQNTRTITLKTSNPIKTEYLDKIDTKGYLILNEKTYTSQGDGVVDYNVRDGQRVPKDHVIANLNLMGDASDLKDELLKVQSAIEYKNQNLNPSTTAYEISDKEINLIYSIQDALVEDDLPNALVAIETLELNTKKNVDISEISTLINLSNQELEDRRDELSREISTNNIVYKSEIAGIVSYKIDKLEEIYTEENIPQIDYEFIRKNPSSTQIGQQNTVKTGDPLYKLIDNFAYFMAVPIDEMSSIENLEVGSSIELLVNSRTTLKGNIYQINQTENTGVIIISLKDKLSELGYDRILDASIIKNKIKSYVISTKSVVEVNNQPGVYIRELNGLVKFRPIHIVNQNDLDTIVETGDNKGYIEDINGESVRTITVFDELIDEPANIEEGQILK
ncbi:MAG: hypothetical protein GX666_05175 [Tissierellia bacterium]|nr:hypothetical protein [Tissierellia bacterium]